MKQVLLTSAALLMSVSLAAMAETTPVQNSAVIPSPNTAARSPDSSAAATPSPSVSDRANMSAGDRANMAANDRQNHLGLRQKLSSNLEQAGFTDVKVIPEAFLVQAKDKDGNPVTMFINPRSMTMVTRESAMDARNTPANPVVADGAFASVASGDELSSKVVGLEVYNNANQNIGKIKDIAFDDNGVQAYIVAVGGFLGMGDHYVAVQPSAVNLSYDANNKKWHAAMNTDADQLKAAPEYKYSIND